MIRTCGLAGLIMIVTMCYSMCEASHQAIETRSVEVRVSINVPSGTSFPTGFPVLVTDGKQRFGSPTDAAGKANITCVVPINCERLSVILGVVLLPPAASAEEQAAWKAAQLTADRTFVLPPARRIQLSTGQSVYSISYSLDEAISISGRLVTPGGQPIKNAEIERPGLLQITRRSASDGTFDIGGIKKGADSWLFIIPKQTLCDEIMVIKLESAQNSASRNVGDLVVAPSEHVGRVSITAEGRDAMPSDESGERDFVSLVRVTDQRIVCSVLDVNGKTSDGLGGAIKVPVGDYFMLPGMPWSGTRVQKCLRLLKAGRQSDLENAGMSVIHISENATTAQTVNVLQESTKIDGVAE